MSQRTKTVLLSLVLVVVLAGHGLVLRQVWEQILFGGADFTAFYAAGQVVSEGQGPQLYRYETQQEFQRHLPWRKEPLPFYHPPYEVLLFLPLAQLPFPSAFLIWYAANLLLVGACALVRHPEDHPTLEATLVRAIAMLLFYPVLLALLQGQDSVLLLLLISLAFIALRQGRDLRTGCFLGLALFKFQFVLPLLLVFLWMKKTRVLAGVLATLAVLTLVSVLLVGWEGVADYPRFLLESNRSLGRGTIHPESMPTVRGMLALMPGGLPEPALTVITAVLSAALLIAGALQWPAGHGAPDSRFDLAFALSVVLAVLVSYHVNGHDLSLLLLPMGLLARHLRATRGQGRLWRKLLTVLLAALFVPPFLFPGNFLAPSLAFWVMLLLSAAMIREIRAQAAPGHAH